MNAIFDAAPEEAKAHIAHFRDFVADSPRGIIR